MSNTVPDLGARTARPAWLLREGRVPERIVWAIAAIVALYYARLFWLTEGLVPNILFTAGVSLAIASALTLLTRRLLFATTLTGAFIAIIYLTAATKRKIMFSVVHAYDLVFYLSSWSTISYLWSDFRVYVLAFFGGVASLIIAGVVAWRLDSTRVDRRSAALAFLASALVGAYGA
ncbi:MAG TPA: hypothetical protein PK264_24665, partial [Hyphomicrobiaceae bacterium]|nr:hypothetical protein [Hyphomicrobiaceae bacterium]